jgi:mRNA-degrading endonuclease RelE of RelBE toxin-antitoxin system
MEINVKVANPCSEKRDFCVNCHSHFMEVRPLIKGVAVSRHFIRDLKDEEVINSIIQNILDCLNLDFTELHKFEMHIDGNMIFRAKKEDLHIVYCVDKKSRIIFLRALKNFNEYKKFLENKKQIKKMIETLG